jgi:hypothetical protein
MTPPTNRVDSAEDLGAVMRLALEEEREIRGRLLNELEQSRLTAEHRQELLEQRQREAQRLQQTLEERQKEQAMLAQQFSSAQLNVSNLNRQLQSRSTEAVLTKEQLAAMEADLRRQNEQAAALQAQLQELARSNQLVLNEKQQLAGQLRVAEVERRHAVEQATAMKEQVQVERAEKARLAEGFQALASTSSQLVEEMVENRPLSPNAVFNQFLTNRVYMQISGTRPALLGARAASKASKTVLVAADSKIFALSHVEETPFSLWSPGTDWASLSGTLAHGSGTVPIRSLLFSVRDPRVVLIPVPETQAAELGAKVYRTSAEPFKFQDAVLVGADEGYYGECRFEIDPTTPGYVKLDRSVLRGLFGKFNPTRGDIVFSKTGEVIGIMANATYCMMLTSFDAGATISFDPNTPGPRTGITLSSLYSSLQQMPYKLQ